MWKQLSRLFWQVSHPGLCASRGKGRRLLRYDANRHFFAYKVFKTLLFNHSSLAIRFRVQFQSVTVERPALNWGMKPCSLWSAPGFLSAWFVFQFPSPMTGSAHRRELFQAGIKWEQPLFIKEKSVQFVSVFNGDRSSCQGKRDERAEILPLRHSDSWAAGVFVVAFNSPAWTLGLCNVWQQSVLHFYALWIKYFLFV